MLKLYYTVASAYDAPQDNPSNSTGGYKSSTSINNELIDSVFDELSLRGMANPSPQYKAIVVVNESDTTISNLQLYFETPIDQITYCGFTVAAVQMSVDAEGNPVMERSQNMYSKPFYAQFYQATKESPVSLGDLEAGQSLGIWLCRTPNKEIIETDYNNVAEIDPLRSARGSWYKRVEKSQEELVDVIFEWD